MPLAKSKITAAFVSQNINRWCTWEIPIQKNNLKGEQLTAIKHRGQFGVNFGNLLVLTGITCQVDEQACEAHISITPGPVSGKWTYFHLTIVGGKGGSAYYQLETNFHGQLVVVKSSYTQMPNGVENVTGFGATITLPAAVTLDLTYIMRAFLKDDYKEGLAT